MTELANAACVMRLHHGSSTPAAIWAVLPSSAGLTASRTLFPRPCPQFLADLVQRSGRDLPKHEETREREIPSDNLEIRQVWVRNCVHSSVSLHALGLDPAGTVEALGHFVNGRITRERSKSSSGW
jgi:hypothetical protein